MEEQATICTSCKKNPLPTPRHEFCEICAIARRKMQLVVNNRKWKMKIEKGEAGHKIMYAGQPTQWARENPVQAIREAIKQGFDDEALNALIAGMLRRGF